VPSTYLLTWNPNRWTWDTLARDARRSTEGDVVKERWSSGNTKRIAPGDRLFLMRLGMEPRGIVASGWAISVPQPGPHWDDERAAKGDTALYVDAEFERVLDPDVAAPLAIKDLERNFPDFPWSPQASGFEIPGDVAVGLESAWGSRAGEPVVIDKVNLAEKLALFSDHWSPKVVGKLNGQHVKLVKFSGPFAWHHHEAEDGS
jgi:hypothetical protein